MSVAEGGEVSLGVKVWGEKVGAGELFWVGEGVEVVVGGGVFVGQVVFVVVVVGCDWVTFRGGG